MLPVASCPAVSVPLSSGASMPPCTGADKCLQWPQGCTCSLCRHPYTRSLTLTNGSKLPSKFEIVPQENQSKGLALIKVEPEAGGLPALGSQTVQVTLKTSRLGRIQLPLKLKVGT